SVRSYFISSMPSSFIWSETATVSIPGISAPGFSSVVADELLVLVVSADVVLLFSFDPLPPHEARNNKAAAAGTKNSLFMSLFLWLFKENAKLRLMRLLKIFLSNFTPLCTNYSRYSNPLYFKRLVKI